MAQAVRRQIEAIAGEACERRQSDVMAKAQEEIDAWESLLEEASAGQKAVRAEIDEGEWQLAQAEIDEKRAQLQEPGAAAAVARQKTSAGPGAGGAFGGGRGKRSAAGRGAGRNRPGTAGAGNAEKRAVVCSR